MKLRYFQVYDKNGRNSPYLLHYWDEKEGTWMPIEYVRVSYKDEDGAMKNEWVV